MLARLEKQLANIVVDDPFRFAVCAAVERLQLVDCWVAAGFVRNAVWDYLHGYGRPTSLNDVDVVHFDPADTSARSDKRLEHALQTEFSGVRFSVKNQARMHSRNNDLPYSSTTDALRYWPETCTAVGVAVDKGGALASTAPYGLDDLFNLLVRPTSRRAEIVALAHKRFATRHWAKTWPRLRLVEPH